MINAFYIIKDKMIERDKFYNFLKEKKDNFNNDIEKQNYKYIDANDFDKDLFVEKTNNTLNEFVKKYQIEYEKNIARKMLLLLNKCEYEYVIVEFLEFEIFKIIEKSSYLNDILKKWFDLEKKGNILNTEETIELCKFILERNDNE